MNQHYFSVKTTFTTFALSLALCAAAGATAQPRSAAPASAADSVMLSETADGDYIVRRYFVKRQSDSRYSVRYLINLSTLNAALAGNGAELGDLDAFVQKLMADSLLRVEKVDITGYSSPDGPVAFNERLAKNRAQNFRSYVDRKYDFSERYKVDVSSVAEDWEMCRQLVARSSMPDRQAVLEIIDSRRTPEAKEAELKKMPAAWSYMVREILPPLRRVEMTIDYGAGDVVVVRTKIPRPAPEPVCAPEPEPCAPCCCDTVVEEGITGIIVEMPDPDADRHRAVHDAAHDARVAHRDVRHEVHGADRIAREEMKAARKIAKKEAKAARKADKAAGKAARRMGRM